MTEFHAVVHQEDGRYWAEVQELPGCFASGADLNELKDALVEAITLYLDQEGATSGAHAACNRHVWHRLGCGCKVCERCGEWIIDQGSHTQAAAERETP